MNEDAELRSALLVIAIAALLGSIAPSAMLAAGADDKPVEVGPGITPPLAKTRTDARYPEKVRAAGIGGVVVVRALIDRKGKVHQVEAVSSPDKRLSKAARDAVIMRRYEPATRDGEPIAVWWNETFRFLTEAEEIEQFAKCDPTLVDAASPSDAGTVTPPVLVRNAPVVTPERMAEDRRPGRVLLQCLIDVCGRVHDCKALESSTADFTTAAIKGVEKRLYRPATKNGKPIEIFFTIRVDFRYR